MPVQAIPPSGLRRICQHPHFTFETTAEIDSHDSIIGQPRGTRAIEFGIAIQSQGYNMFVLGESGTGRTTAIKRFLEQKTSSQPAPSDWVYVNNFAIPHQPRAIRLPAGGGAAFHGEIHRLLERLQGDLPKAFDSDTYRDAMEALTRQFDRQQEELFLAMQNKAAEQNMALVSTPSGPVIAPLDDTGQVLTPESFQQLPPDTRAQFLQQQEVLQSELEDVMRDLRLLDSEHRTGLRELNRTVAGTAIEHHFAACRQLYREFGDVLHYLDEMQADVVDNLDAFL
jgi:Cdc6-like AAA superfamily ATPase